MNSMGAQAVLAVLLTIGTVQADKGVSFWRTKFTMHCPGAEGVQWFKKDIKEAVNDTQINYEQEYEGKTKGNYYCEYTEEGNTKKYFFYVQGKVCENCYELDPLFLLLAIVVDVIGTVIVMMTIYQCTKKKSVPVSRSSKAPPARSGGRAPPVPSPDYEQLNHRAQDTYSALRT